MIKVSAPGKIHLSGEHSVVYGQPALLSAINKRMVITLKRRTDKKIKIQNKKFKNLDLVNFGIKKIYQCFKRQPNKGFSLKINSQIPAGMGLGSSSALAVSLTGAIYLLETKRSDPEISGSDLNKINKIAYEIEKRQHSNPSGGDNTIVCYGGFLRFQKQNDGFQFKQLKVRKKELPEFLLINSGKPIESTGEMVLAVKARYQKSKIKYQKLVRAIGSITKKMIKAFKVAKFNGLKDLIKENERLLENLGVVGNKSKKIIKKIEKIGGSAKICGAGGIKGGSGMILAYHSEIKALKDFLVQQKLRFMKVNLCQAGLRQDK